jgi:hypothetical protein
MAARVIHFGRDAGDSCVPALRHAGFEVRESNSLDRLNLDLQRDEGVDAVIVSESEPRTAEQAASLVRKHSGAPLTLIRRSDAPMDESRFDRVFSSSAPEANWLFDTAVLVMQCRELRAESERLRRESEVLLAKNERLTNQSRHLLDELGAVSRETQRHLTKARAEKSRKVPSGWPPHDQKQK